MNAQQLGIHAVGPNQHVTSISVAARWYSWYNTVSLFSTAPCEMTIPAQKKKKGGTKVGPHLSRDRDPSYPGISSGDMLTVNLPTSKVAVYALELANNYLRSGLTPSLLEILFGDKFCLKLVYGGTWGL